MNRSGTARGWSQSSVVERSRWDSAVKALDGGVLQSWAWGEWYRHYGFTVERVRVDGPHGTGLAQVMVWPHGPVAEARLAQMHKRRRYDVRLGQRRGVVVEQVTPDAAGLMTFYALFQDTARRIEYSSEPLSYYES